MKVQIQTQSLRVRLDESELAQLLSGALLELQCAWAGAPLFAMHLALGDDLQLRPAPAWTLCLPENEVRAYVTTLPCKRALSWQLEEGTRNALLLEFEVDVRDSLQLRGPRRRTRQPPCAEAGSPR